MKAVAVTSPGKVEIIDAPIPEPLPCHALVKTGLAFVCNNTDGELACGSFPGMEESFPFALRHESVGVVREVSDEVRHFRVGERAVSGLVFELGGDGLEPVLRILGKSAQ